ncbi:MAG: 50S ribosomal protein L3 [Candidatus Omnitrophica bacterium CG08_land_8_20_14_0_20_41_16]|uniref:Large ribosomal subunit protein uL3 n=1 Tax=Candidatus Sherwoodlollariibacterium unditelluris TaxID=1974757 RepID=A0A2G9YHM9_9BACT|nr:MAG: 50S ribosomal protein L3 [Candidatus Omnitrophica bacterium CG23_combo_of_CG06-09_8_20_14_all_41_10]PIS33797.1 MAG: 50S ribosomal protein L3 [Candidatus Omnitrophica bacterium CG08_land_8_20_14_0_20_41_16]
MTGILGKKIGVTQAFTEDGSLVSVTVIEAGPCSVLAIKNKSVQLGFEQINEKRLKKPIAGYFKKINVSCRKFIREVPKDPSKEYRVGEELKVDIFAPGDFVDVTGVSKGKGFQGGMKRWHWKGGPRTHGSTSHRRVGSIGSSTTPGRTFRGHHMPGHMGAERVTLENLKVIKTDLENNILLVKGAIPGCKNGYVIIKKAKKK